MNNLISVIIPTRNRHILLKDAVASVAAQTYPEVECIVVDDGSDTPVDSVARGAWQGRPSERIKIIRQPPSNGNVARNLGLSESTGDYVQYLDSDDLLHPQKLEVQFNQLYACSELDMVYSYEEFFEEKPGDLRLAWNLEWNRTDFDALDRFCWQDPPWQTSAPLWKRGFLEHAVRWNDKLEAWQDWEYHVLALISGCKFAVTPFFLVFIRSHTGSRVSKTIDPFRLLSNQLLALDSIIDGFSRHGGATIQRFSFLEELVLRWYDEVPFCGDYNSIVLRKKTIDILLRLCGTNKKRTLLRILKILVVSPKLFSRVFAMHRKLINLCWHPKSTFSRYLISSGAGMQIKRML